MGGFHAQGASKRIGALRVKYVGDCSSLGSLDLHLHAGRLRGVRSTFSCIGDAATQKALRALVLVHSVPALALGRHGARETDGVPIRDGNQLERGTELAQDCCSCMTQDPSHTPEKLREMAEQCSRLAAGLGDAKTIDLLRDYARELLEAAEQAEKTEHRRDA